MSILIRGKEMPKSCEECPFLDDIGPYATCTLTNEYLALAPKTENWRLYDCPLIEVPTPHGRLIDADALRKSFKESVDECDKWVDEMRKSENDEIAIRAEQALSTFVECSIRVKNAPTIIESEEA